MGETVRVAAVQPRMRIFDRRINPLDSRFSMSELERYYEENLEIAAALVDEAGQRGAKVVCTQEDVTGAGHFVNFSNRPELFDKGCFPVPGESTDTFARIAKKHGMYVVCCQFERAGDHVFNTAALLEPTGNLQGVYRKVQLAAQETFRVDPGDSFEVFETEYGRVGIEICYDLWFPEVSRILSLKGADIIFNPTESFGWAEDIGLCKVRTRAEENHVNLVVARKYKSWDKPGRSCVVNPYGTIVADAGYAANAVVTADVEIGPKKQPDLHHVTLFTGITDMREYSTKERRPDLYGYLTERKPDILSRYSNRQIDTRSNPDDLVRKLELLYLHHKDFMETGDLDL